MSRNDTDNIISPRAADLLLTLRDGDAALLYLYFCRHGFRDAGRAGKELFLPRQRLQDAVERLEMQGLLLQAGPDAFAPGPNASRESPAATAAAAFAAQTESGDLPPYTAAEVSSRAENDGDFAALLNEAKLILGRPLSTPDLVKMLGIYEHFDLPPEVMMELMHFVADVYRERYGEGRRPTVGAFEREARVWVQQEIRDFDGAEQYIQRWRERRSLEGALKDAMQIVNRGFTETERRYIAQWLDWGFLPDAIALAYDITVTNTRKFSPRYMDSILQRWHEKGLHTPQEIREKDRPAQAGRGGSGASGGSGSSGPIDPRKLSDITQLIGGVKKAEKEEERHGA